VSRLSRFAANVRFNAYGQVVQAALPFFFVPFIIGRLGKEAYSLYALIGILTSQLNLLNFGAGPTTVKYLAQFNAAGGRRDEERLLGNSFLFYCATGLLGAALILLSGPLLRDKLLRVPPGLEAVAGFILSCAAAVFLFQSMARMFHAVPQALQRFDVWNGLETATSVFLYVGLGALLFLGRGLRALALWSAAAAAFNLAAYLVVSRRLLPGLRPRPSFDGGMMRKVTGFGGRLLVIQACWSVLNQLDKFVVRGWVSLADLAYYLVAFSLAQKLTLLLSPILPIVLPFSSALHGRGDRGTARRLYLGGTKLAALVIWPVGVLMFFFGPAFLELWLGGAFSERAGWVLRVFVLGTLANIVPAVGSVIAQGFGRVRAPALIALASTFAGVVLWSLLIPSYGMVGAAWSFAAAGGLNALALLAWINGRLLDVPWRRFAASLARPLLLSSGLAAVCFALRNSLKGWIVLGLYGAFAYACFLVLAYFLALDPEEKSRVRELV